jgi:uncharacterized protein YcfJ
MLSSVAQANTTYFDNAKIISIEPMYRDHTVRRPYQDCYIKSVYVENKRMSDGSATNELLGGILGGAIGNQFGGGSGKDALTVAGALLGASVANDMEKAPRGGHMMDKRVCETKYDTFTESRFSHYLIRYNYQDREFSYKSSIRPRDGANIKVQVSVNPMLR